MQIKFSWHLFLQICAGVVQIGNLMLHAAGITPIEHDVVSTTVAVAQVFLHNYATNQTPTK